VINLKLADIHIGDRVHITEWEDMASEFGCNRRGTIECQFQFIKEMEPLCGKEFVVTEKSYDGKVYFNDGDIWWGWNISADMLEPASSIEIEPFTDNELESLLSG
jgi:hypothetical protein